MIMRAGAGTGRSLKLLLALAALVAVAGCEAGSLEDDDYFVPTASYQRYPIEVTKGPVQLDVSTKSVRLNDKQKDTLVRFAQQARSNRASVVHVRRPSGGGRSIGVAAAIERVLVEQGVPESMIVQTTYPGNARAPVVVSYTRTYAVTKECGDWSDDITQTYRNEGYPDFGCSNQHNVAAMVANPEDLVKPRTMTPSDPMRRSTVFDKYREGVPTNTQPPQQQQVVISSVAQ
jgi:pilus assembly protein CpaD